MIVILGPTPCATCGAPVTVVRRDVAYWCPGHGRVCWFESRSAHVVNDDGATHICALTGERTFDMMEAAGASGQSHILNVAPVSQLAPGVRASFHAGSKTA